MKLGKHIYQNSHFLKQLSDCRSQRQCQSLIKFANSDQLLSLVEIALNLLKSRLPLTLRQRNQFSRYANFIRNLSRVKSEKSARRILQQPQTGRGLPALLAGLLIPLIGDAVIEFVEGGK
jgi:hypothetical protein